MRWQLYDTHYCSKKNSFVTTHHSVKSNDLLFEYAVAASSGRPNFTNKWSAEASSFKAIGDTNGAFANSGSLRSFFAMCLKASFFRRRPSERCSHIRLVRLSIDLNILCSAANCFFDSVFSVSLSCYFCGKYMRGEYILNPCSYGRGRREKSTYLAHDFIDFHLCFQ